MLFQHGCCTSRSWLSTALLAGCCLSLGCQREAAEPTSSTPKIITVATATASTEKVKPPVVDAEADEATLVARYVPDWVSDAIFYQIFPERFRNGDPTNDPTVESLESSDVAFDWEVTPWTSDWYARDKWDRGNAENFFEGGVFNRRYGGDLQGILYKLDYLESLGINAIYLNPVFYGRSLHKYDGASMHHIDPYFGPDPKGDLEQMARETSDPKTWRWTAADKLFLKLVEQLHKRSIRVIIDGVFNHTGRDFFAFADLRKNQEKSAYRDWYIVQDFDNPDTPNNEFRYKSWWGFETLPEFADDPTQQDLHPGPKRYVFDITRRWMDPNGDGDPSDGIDGWRLDVANEVPPGFWRDWNSLVRELNPQAYTVGEFWGDARQHLIDGRFSGTMNYHGFAYLVKGFLVDDKLTAHDFGLQLQQRREEYPEAMQYALQNLVDSHDTDRIASMIVNASDGTYRQAERFDYDVSEAVSPRGNTDYKITSPSAEQRQIQRLVAFMQMTYLGAPMVYYGTEAGMWGGDDPCDRKPMVWADLQYDDEIADPFGRPREPDPVAFNDELFDYYRGLVHLRRGSDLLRRGRVEVLTHDDASKFIAFRRILDDQSLIVAINRGKESFDFQFPINAGQTPEIAFRVSAGDDELPLAASGRLATLTLPGLDAVVVSLPSAEN
ncbi:MAG: glycoside hydrolase family 13 protein [Planctomycetota bacterium]